MSEITTAKENAQSTSTVKKITATAVMAALTTLMTAYIFHIPVGVNGGYVHLGDTMIYLAAAFLPLPYACAAGAIGGGLADLLTAPVWAPATIIIKMLICLPFSSKGKKLVTKRQDCGSTERNSVKSKKIFTVTGEKIRERALYCCYDSSAKPFLVSILFGRHMGFMLSLK